MNFSYRLSAALVGTAMVAVQLPFSVAVAQDVSTIAQEITVRIDGPKAGGSGVIVKREGNTYTVLTNWHVVDNAGDYVIQTSDGKRHRVNYRQEMSGLDLARLQFTSTQSYRVAELGNSENVSRNQSVYVSGWLNPIPGINERSYQFIRGNITSILSQPQEGGYALVYNTTGNYKGMSGGPVLNEQGQVVAINGRAAGDWITGPVGLYLGIPSNRFASIISKPKPRFFCGRHNGVPATIVRDPSRGEIETVAIRWVSEYHSGSGFTPQTRCEEVSARLQFYHENNMLTYLIAGRFNHYPVICVAEYRDQECTAENILFTLRPWDDAYEIIEDLFRGRGPLSL